MFGAMRTAGEHADSLPAPPADTVTLRAGRVERSVVADTSDEHYAGRVLKMPPGGSGGARPTPASPPRRTHLRVV